MSRLLVALIALVVLAIPINTTIADSSIKTNDLQQAYYNQQAEYQWSSELVTYSKTLVGKKTGQCVVSIRQYFGVPKSEVQGLARNTKINSQTGKVGAIVVFKNMSWAGHVGYQITPVDSQGNFQYFDSNGGWSMRGAIRTININDRRISGYRIYR